MEMSLVQFEIFSELIQMLLDADELKRQNQDISRDVWIAAEEKVKIQKVLTDESKRLFNVFKESFNLCLLWWKDTNFYLVRLK